jgi:hypothetical protein
MEFCKIKNEIGTNGFLDYGIIFHEKNSSKFTNHYL